MNKTLWLLPMLALSLPAAAETRDDAFSRALEEGGVRLLHVQSPPAERPLTTELKYVKRSMEYQATIKHVYDLAALQVLPELARQKKEWALVFDVDETVLDNSEYQVRVTKNGCGYQGSTWDGWVHESAAAPIAPAKEFIDKVRAFMAANPRPKGHVVYITDRNDGQKDATLANLRKVGLFVDGDLMLTKAFTAKGAPLDTKDVRRDCVQKGNSGSDARCAGIGPSEIVATFGDSFRDHFEYYGDQALHEGREALDRCVAAFRCFVIPNPLYGQWDDQGANGPYERFKPNPVQAPLPAHCPAR